VPASIPTIHDELRHNATLHEGSSKPRLGLQKLGMPFYNCTDKMQLHRDDHENIETGVQGSWERKTVKSSLKCMKTA
jgi:hypothetical protein